MFRQSESEITLIKMVRPKKIKKETYKAKGWVSDSSDYGDSSAEDELYCFDEELIKNQSQKNK